MDSVAKLKRRVHAGAGASQSGVAILLAMLTVALVASLAATALAARYRLVETEAAERSRVQSSALLIGALDWARLILREDLRASRIDHLAEPWSVGLEESRLSTFLAADRGNAAVLDGSEDVFLSGRIQDLQARFNVLGIASRGQFQATELAAWIRLFRQLKLNPSDAERVAENLRFATDPDRNSSAQTAASLVPHRVQDLLALGLSAQSLRVLEPHITVLPQLTPVNINTADIEVLQAVLPKLDAAQARRVVAHRERQPFANLAELTALLPSAAPDVVDTRLSVFSRFFLVQGQIRLGERITQEQSLVQRESMNDIRILWRERSSQLLSLDLGNAKSGASLLQSQP